MTQPTAASAAKRIPRQEAIENLAVRYAAAREKVAVEEICIKHFRPTFIGSSHVVRTHNGGFTVAYRQRKTDSFVEVATSICSPKDGFSRHVGTTLAVEQFMNERRVRIPLCGLEPSDVVELMFRDLITVDVSGS